MKKKMMMKEKMKGKSMSMGMENKMPEHMKEVKKHSSMMKKKMK